MADPLSIASCVAGLLSLGIQVTQSLVDFYSDYKSKNAGLAKITQNIESLQRMFISLKDAVRRTHELDLLQEVDKTTTRCEVIIEELQTECQKFQKHPDASFKDRIQILGRGAAYPFRKSTLLKLEEDMGEMRSILSIALGVLQLKTHNQIQDELSELKLLLERTNANQMSFSIRSWLAAPDASLNHNAACAKRHESTGVWLVNDYRFANWLIERNSFLWLSGFAGCGKSVICSTAIQYAFRETKDTDGVGIAFFYFSFTDDSKQHVRGMLSSLVSQLSVQIQDGEKELEQCKTLCRTNTPSTEVLLELLRRFLLCFEHSYLFIDALDECPREHAREDVLRAIQVMRDWKFSSTHLLVTSRDYFDIRDSLSPSADQDLVMRNSGIDRDIIKFVSLQLSDDKKLQRVWMYICILLGKTMTEICSFRYVECQLNALRRARNRNQLDECLRSLPRDLDETYERILCSIDESYVDDVRRILTLLCFSIKPLTVNQLIHAHAVELGEPPRLDLEGRSYDQDGLIDICLGLVETQDYEDKASKKAMSIARIAHFSVQEYLQSERIQRQKAKNFVLEKKHANTEIAQILLVYLLDPSLSNGTMSAEKLQDFPLARYAAENWHHYFLESSQRDPNLEKVLCRLFQCDMDAFVTWTRLYNIIEKPWRSPKFELSIDTIAHPLYYAACLGLESIVSSVASSEIQGHSTSNIVNAQCGKDGSALLVAARNGHAMVVQMLLDRGADINPQHGRYGNALQAAASRGHTQIMQILLDRGADVNTQGGKHGCALQAASYKGFEKAVQLLLDQGADVDIQGGKSGNALRAACRTCHTGVVQMLLDRGAEVNAQGGKYGNALQAAICRGRSAIVIVKILLDHGADVDARVGSHDNALQAAANRGGIEAVKMLLDHGADVNAQGGKYGNALKKATQKGDKRVIQLLLDYGAKPSEDLQVEVNTPDCFTR